MSDIPELDALLSKRVRVHLNHGGGVLAEGEMIGYYDHPSLCIRQDDGTQIAVSSQLRREVVAPPLPPEPPVGAYVEVQWAPDSSPEIFRKSDVMDAEAKAAWCRVPDGWRQTWAELHEELAKVTRLYRADDIPQRAQGPLADWELELLEQKAAEQPQEKYERATDSGREWLWRHCCDNIGAFPVGQTPRDHCIKCNGSSEWTPLYRRSSDG